MPEIFVEQRAGAYVAIRENVIVARGSTQKECAAKVKKLYRDKVHLVRVRNKPTGNRGQTRPDP